MTTTETKFACLFPGQGSQSVGMSKTLCDNFSWAKEIYEEASDAANENLLRLCQDGPEDALQLTQNQQPCILTTSYAWYQVLRRELDFRPHAAAGHSLGEYTALLCSGAMNLSTAVALVRKRGQLMQEAVPVGEGKMAAVIGLSDEAVQALCEKASTPKAIAVPANFNAPNQVVIAGHSEAIDQAMELGKNPPFKARKLIPLNVSAPFHSPLMQPMADKFEVFLKDTQWGEFQFPIAFNVDAQLRTEANELVSVMKSQLDHPVRWTQCVQTLREKAQCNVCIEPGPGKVLSGLNRRIDKTLKTFSIDSIEGLKAFQTQ